MNDLKKRVSQLNPGTDFLEKILGEVPSGKPKALGYNYKALNKHQQNQDTKFTPAEEVFDPYTGNMMLQHSQQHPKTYPSPKPHQHHKTFSNPHHVPRNKGRSRRWICHHCGKKGTYKAFLFQAVWVSRAVSASKHIRPFCLKLYEYPGVPDFTNQLYKHVN
jgi:hypothetical protein